MALGNALARINAQRAEAEAAKAAKPKRREWDQFLGVDLGLNESASMLAGIPGGIAKIVTSAAPGGEKSMLPQFGRAVLGSFAGTAATIGGASLPGIGQWTPGGLLERGAESALDMDVRDFRETVSEDGLIPGLIEHVGNAALVGGAASQTLKAGLVGKLAKGVVAPNLAKQGIISSTKAAKWASRADELATSTGKMGSLEAAAAMPDVAARIKMLTAATKIAHPYRTLWWKGVRPLGAKGVLDEATKLDEADDAARAASKSDAADVIEGAEPPDLDQFSALMEEAGARPKAVRGQATADVAPGKAGGLQAALDEAVASTTRPARLEPGTEGTTTLYRGEAPGNVTNAGEGADVGSWYTDDIEAARGWAGETGEVLEVAVPNELLDEFKAGNVQVGDEGRLVGQYQVPEEWRAVRRAGEPQADLRADLADADVARATEIAEEVRAARAGIGEPADYSEAARRLIEIQNQQMAQAEWVNRLWAKLPTSLQNALRKAGHKWTARDIARVKRDMERMQEGAQRIARHSPAVLAAQRAADTIIQEALPDANLHEVSKIVGEEIASRMDATGHLAEEMTRIFSANGVPAEVIEMAREAMMRGYEGVSPALKRQLDEAGKLGAFDEAVDAAVVAWRGQKEQTVKTLLASRVGAKGMEAVLMDTVTGGYTREMRSRLMRVNRMVNKATDQELGWAARQTAAARKRILTLKSKLHALADIDETIDDPNLFSKMRHSNMALGRGMRTRASMTRSAQRVVEQTPIGEGVEGGMTYNVAAGRTVNFVANGGTDEGWTVAVKAVGEYDHADWAVNGQRYVEEAMLRNRTLLANPDARIGTWSSDGKVYLDISMHTADGVPLTRDQAVVLGMAGDQISLYDGTTGGLAFLPRTPALAHIAANMVDLAMDPNSGFSRWAKSFRETFESGSHYLNQSMADDALPLHMLQAWNVAGGDASKLDDFFKQTIIEAGKGRPTTSTALLEAIHGPRALNPKKFDAILKTAEHFEGMVDWYFKSHEYIEGMRWLPDGSERTITLLNGTERNVADIFYDLLAVTSINNKPVQNFGNAMQGLINLIEETSTNGPNWMQKVQREMAALEAQRGGRSAKQTSSSARRTSEVILEGEKSQGPSRKFYKSIAQRLGRGSHQFNFTQQMVYDILAGNIDLSTMTLDDLQLWWKRWFDQERRFNVEKALKDPKVAELAARRADSKFAKAFGGPEEFALMEAFGPAAWSKLRSFRQNLANPQDAMAVTMDSWHGKGFGVEWDSARSVRKSGEVWIGPRTAQRTPESKAGSVLEANNRVRALADKMDIEGNRVQAVYWADVIHRLREGGFTAEYARDFADIGMGRGGTPYQSQAVAARRLESMGIDLGVEVGSAPLTPDGVALARGINPRERLDLMGPFDDADPRFATFEADETGTAVQRAASMKLRTIGSPADRARGITPETLDNIAVDLEEAVNRIIHPDEGRARGVHLIEAEAYRDIPDLRDMFDEGSLTPRPEFYDPAARARIDEALAAKVKATARKTDVGAGGRSIAEQWSTLQDTWDDLKKVYGDTPAGQRAGDSIGMFEEITDQVGDAILMGALVPMDKGARLAIRMFQNADFGTFLHESGHLLRQMLTPEQLAVVERAYGFRFADLEPGSPAWRLAEERFADDFIRYMRGATPERMERVPALKGAFEIIGSETRLMYDNTRFAAGSVPSDIENILDTVFAPEIGQAADIPWLKRALPEAMDQGLLPEEGTITQRAQALRRMEGESDFAFGERMRRAGQITQEEHTRAAKHATVKARRQAYERRIKELETQIDRGQLSGAKAVKRTRKDAQTELNRLVREMRKGGRPVPAWEPLTEAIRAIQEMADGDEMLQAAIAQGDLLGDPFEAALRFASEQGIDVTHVGDMTWSKANALLFDNVRLGRQNLGKQIEAGTRSERTGALHKQGLADRSIEALAAHHLDATHELYTNAVVDTIETAVARAIPVDGIIPDGWVAWEPQRTALLTSEKITDAGLQRYTNAQSMIPEPVAKMLKNMSTDYDHWSFKMLAKPTSFWRNFALTFSPRWYVNNVFGNIILATAEGVTIRDWISAWKSMRGQLIDGRRIRLPDVQELHGRSFFSAVPGEAGAGAGTLLTRPGGPVARVKGARKAEGWLSASAEGQQSIKRLNEGFDEFARAAVFHSHMRNGSTRSQALGRAYEALVDYGNMSPFERTVIRSAIPFYSWQKGVFKLLTKFPSDHPIATAVLFHLGNLNMELLEDRLGVDEVPSGYAGLADFGPLGVRNTRSINPFADAQSLATPDGIAQALNPFLDIFLRTGYNAPEGFPEEGFTFDDFGNVVPLVTPQHELVNLGATLPQTRAAAQTLLGGDSYGQSPSIGASVASLAGVPKGYDEPALERLRERLSGGQSRIGQ